MCDECRPANNNKEFILTNARINKLGFYHCLDGPAGFCPFNKRYEWCIDGRIVGGYLNPVASQEEFEKSKEYREWKLKAFK